MSKTKMLSLAAVTLLMAIGCKEPKKKDVKSPMATESEIISEASSITIEKLEGSPEYADASLKMMKSVEMKISKAGEVDFAFDVNNYELGAQTESKNADRLANSGKGQHIHFILNNQPYSAHYEPNFKKEIPEGVHHLVAFLSRSYHESVKNDNSVVVKKLMVGSDPKDVQDLDMEAPTLIYSRPKGEYAGKDTENLLLDFFVLNTTLSEKGNKVRATINGEVFMITEWAPQVIKGLPLGEVTINLELLDAEENLIPGVFNEVTRTVMLKE
ncbi:hypothetical protein ESY86_05420 [Subsaximicrobium wynnwilliamsii]|uniref:Phosphopeptide-binding protein n=1 Tax=Subsaximicrobium wynnwilliamsii TaxID=291179 RepID=A0A5C6ZLQ8_9FLAO|nr:hypothetical protein [Subsaximicrobium wynnwilliamsii]TXD84499.1 hypothetical protein ESY87_05195 [Subsaximicrobium wynnwilliamsii]TXD90181.1 hypothetical protein ESY86_05420 [Subsaximicrobium wynnwilliamsii]TXE04232.1 hypothetical protein ESY88_05190 [Subsaximicrobium wynnwilliamsii]